VTAASLALTGVLQRPYRQRTTWPKTAGCLRRHGIQNLGPDRCPRAGQYHPDRFSLTIAGPDGRGDVGPLIECMRLLWEGQSSRHGSSTPTREETPAEATMAAHLAAMLVQWLTSGAVMRSDGI